MVILARASFSGSEMKSRWMSGCSLSNRWDRLMASCICELDTIATAMVVPELPPVNICFVPMLQPVRASAAPPAAPARKARRLSGAGEGVAPDGASGRVIVASLVQVSAWALPLSALI